MFRSLAPDENEQNGSKLQGPEDLPGGVRAGDKVVSLIEFSRASGERVSKGDRGTVMGPGKGKAAEGRVEVAFENMKSVRLLPRMFECLCPIKFEVWSSTAKAWVLPDQVTVQGDTTSESAFYNIEMTVPGLGKCRKAVRCDSNNIRFL